MKKPKGELTVTGLRRRVRELERKLAANETVTRSTVGLNTDQATMLETAMRRMEQAEDRERLSRARLLELRAAWTHFHNLIAEIRP